MPRKILKYPSKYCRNFGPVIGNFVRFVNVFIGMGSSGYEKLCRGFLDGKQAVEHQSALYDSTSLSVAHALSIH
jgi:hypothetical protein